MEYENQTIEWKEAWRDEYLGWLCGYANARGGTLFVGKDDKGEVVGLNKARKLLEDLPNKIRDMLGIMADVELRTENGLDYLAISVEPYPSSPVNFRGEYHYRTGSTKQVLKGTALNKFLSERMGMRWDAQPVPGIAVSDLDPLAFRLFRTLAARAERVGVEDLARSDENLLDALHLYDKGQLKRAAVLLFYPNPERYVTGAYVKIGFFGDSATDLKFQDEVNGPLLQQVEGTMGLLKTKYMQAAIRYEGIHRVEEYPYPVKALREAVVNAIAHKDYSSGNPVQIRVFPDRLQIWNDGQIPIEWTLEKFLGQHSSKPNNPDIARTFYRIGFIESWGRGIELILAQCEAHGISRPTFSIDFDELEVWFTAKQEVVVEDKNTVSAPELDVVLPLLEHEILPNMTSEKMEAEEVEKLISVIRTLESKSLKIIVRLAKVGASKRKDLMDSVQLTNQTYNVKQYLNPLLSADLVVPTNADRPQSKHKYYLLTEVGRKMALLLQEALDDANTRLS